MDALLTIGTESGNINNFIHHQNYPNPFYPVTKIKFSVPDNSVTGNNCVILVVYDMLERNVLTLVNDKLKPGIYEVAFNAENLSSEIYFYSLVDWRHTGTKKIVID